jgi:hypothetical protein
VAPNASGHVAPPQRKPDVGWPDVGWPERSDVTVCSPATIAPTHSPACWTASGFVTGRDASLPMPGSHDVDLRVPSTDVDEQHPRWKHRIEPGGVLERLSLRTERNVLVREQSPD